jgi:hypothetical protein
MGVVCGRDTTADQVVPVDPLDGEPLNGLSVECHTVEVGYQNAQGTEVLPLDTKMRNARQLKSGPTMANNGFQLVKFEHGITDFTAADISKQMEENFYPKFETLLFKVCPGATKVHVFNHGLRASSVPSGPVPAASAVVKEATVKAPVKEAHSDFSPAYSPNVARKLEPDFDLKNQRYSLINLWMSIDKQNPIMKTPLAFLDSRTVASEELIDFWVKSGGKIDEEWDGNMNPKFRGKLKPAKKKEHGWYYFPRMTSDEAVIFKQYDSTTRESQVCIHAAIELDEDGPKPLPDRQSVEVRALVLFDSKYKATC